MEELKHALERFKNNKPGDEAGLVAELVQVAPTELLETAFLSYNHVLTPGDVPAEWRKTLFTMIPKTMRAKTVTFVLWFLFVFSVFFAYIFFSHTLFCRVARWSPKKYYGSENGFYTGPSPDMHSPRKVQKSISLPGKSTGHGGVRERLGEKLAKGGAGPLHHWWRHLLGWRAATMRRLACQHGSKWPTTGK
jgi:hypothetical protein